MQKITAMFGAGKRGVGKIVKSLVWWDGREEGCLFPLEPQISSRPKVDGLGERKSFPYLLTFLPLNENNT